MSKLPSGWVLVEVGKVSNNIQYGYTASSKIDGEGVRLLRITDIQDGRVNWESVPYCEISKSDFAKYCLKKNDIVFVRTGATVGKSFLIEDVKYDSVFASYLIRFTVAEGILPKYIKHFFNSQSYWKQISDSATGIGQPGVNSKKLAQIKFPLPPLNEQKRIVAKLDKLFAHLDALKARMERVPELLKQFRQSVLTQAVTGKLTEDWRKGKVLDANASNYKSFRKQEYLKESDKLKKLGKKSPKLPEFLLLSSDNKGWAWLNVESASTFIIDCLHSTPKFTNEGCFCIDTTCITPFEILWNNARKVSQEIYKKWVSRLEPTEGDILFSREGTIGTAVKVPKSYKLCIGQRMMLFRFSSFILPEFAEIYLNSTLFKQQYRPKITGTTSPHVNIGDIRKLSFPVPSLKEQKEIVRRVEALFEKAELIERQYKLLKEKIEHLPQAILAKAFRGELVAQDPNDEPAEELLERIQAEKEGRSVKKKQGKQYQLHFEDSLAAEGK